MRAAALTHRTNERNGLLFATDNGLAVPKRALPTVGQLERARHGRGCISPMTHPGSAAAPALPTSPTTRRRAQVG